MSLRSVEAGANRQRQTAGDVARRSRPLVDARPETRAEPMGGFSSASRATALYQRFTPIEVPGWLVEAQPSSVSSSTTRKRPSRSTTAATVTFGFQIPHGISGTQNCLFYPFGAAVRRPAECARIGGLNFCIQLEIPTMSMADRDGFIWYDGKLVPWREALTTHVLTHSSTTAGCRFEGVRAYNTVKRHGDFPPRRAHPAPAQLRQDLHDGAFLTPRKTSWKPSRSRARQQARIVLSAPDRLYGSEKMGISTKGATVHVAIAAWPWGAYPAKTASRRASA